MKVRDIMTQPAVSCQSDNDIATAAKLMLGAHVGTLPVVDARHHIVGIITDRDVAMAAATRHRTAAHIAVHEAMTRAVAHCLADDAIGDALKQMAHVRVRRLPVADEHGHVAGVLSVDDIVQRALDRPGGITPAAFVDALVRIAELPATEPELTFEETFVSG